MQLPCQFFDHFLLLHKHLIFFSFQTIRTSTLSHPLIPPSQLASSSSPMAVLHAELRRGRLQGELWRRGHGHVAETVREWAAERQLWGGWRDGRAGGGAGVRVVPSLRQSAGGRWGLVGRQWPCGCDREGQGGDVGRSCGRGVRIGILEGPESLNESGLGAWDWHATNTQVLPELWNLSEHKTKELHEIYVFVKK